MNKVFLLLGANLGNRFQQLKLAGEAIQKEVGKVSQVSAVYETAAWGVEEGPSYLNQVLRVETSLSPEALLSVTSRIEDALGRTRQFKWDSRLIDIDILFYENLQVETERLIIPHPYLHLRRFTLVPLAEIAPHFLHPVLKKTTLQLLLDLDDPLPVKKVTFL